MGAAAAAARHLVWEVDLWAPFAVLRLGTARVQEAAAEDDHEVDHRQQEHYEASQQRGAE